MNKSTLFLLWKLPSAFFCGVRVKSYSKQQCITTVTHRWINQNPFKSMYFAVQAMAAELSTGVLLNAAITAENASVSMLVTSIKGDFYKKASGRIEFKCDHGELVAQALAAIHTQSQVIVLISEGKNKKDELVSRFEITWSLKTRQR